MNNSGEFDIGPLTWVKDEIDLALKRAGESLKKHAEAAAAEAAPQSESAHLKAARGHLHQAHGALAIVGLNGVTQFTETTEQIFAALADGSLPFSDEVAAACQRALDAVSGYLEELLAGVADQPLRLWPVYRELLALRGVTASTPADLFFPDVAQRPPRREKEPAALVGEALAARLKAARLGFQRGLLKWLKGDAKGIKEMRSSMAVIEFTQSQPASRAFWWAALAFLDALLVEGVPVDSGSKKLCARIDAQIAKLLEGSADIAERLMRDVLYYVAISKPTTDHIECVRAAYRLADLVPAVAMSESGGNVVTPQQLGQLRAMRETLDVAKEDWNRYASHTPGALAQFQAQTKQLIVQGQALGQVDVARLVTGVGSVAGMLSNHSPNGAGDDMALEIATALLLVENALDGYGKLGVDFAHQVDVMAGRLTALLRGETPAAMQAMEVPQLDEISRRAQERLLMNQVVREILGNLAIVEQKLDGFFRDPANKVGDLAGLKLPIKQTVGALTVLGELRAVEVLQECESSVLALAQPGAALEQATFEALANKLSALGFFVEQLRHGPADLDAILNPRPATATSPQSSPEGGRAAPDIEDVDQMAKLMHTALDALRERPDAGEQQGEPAMLAVQGDMASAAIDASDSDAAGIEEIQQLEQAEDHPSLLPPLVPPVQEPSAEAVRLADASTETIDAELLEIFLEEAHEVLDTINQQLPIVSDKPSDHEALTVVRRTFHTLKGSGRMVGLVDLGEAAWAVEQVMNDCLKLTQGASADLLAMLKMAHALFVDWVASLATGRVAPKLDAPAVVELKTACSRLMGEKPVPAVIEIPQEPVTEPVIETVETVEDIVAENAVEPALEGLPADEVMDVLADVPTVVVPEPVVAESRVEPVVQAAAPIVPDDDVMIGELRLSPMVFDIYQGEALSHMATLEAELGALREAPPSRELMRACHTLGGVSGTIGVRSINLLGRALEHALERFESVKVGLDAGQHQLVERTVTALRGMLSDVIERRMPEVDTDLLSAIETLMPAALHQDVAQPAGAVADSVIPESIVETPGADASRVVPGLPDVPDESDVPFADSRRKLRIHDDIDRQLLPIFLEEGADLLREIGAELRTWRATPADAAVALQLQRLLHTLKGSARMAGAMRMGELIHGMESRIIQATRNGAAPAPAFLDEMDSFFDRGLAMLDGLVRLDRGEQVEDEDESVDTAQPASAQPVAPSAEVASVAAALAEAPEVPGQRAQLRVRAELVDSLINEAGEMAIARSRIEGEMRTVKSSLLDLTENIIRLRQQLREIEIQAESQMQSQMSQLQETHQDFDPLEMDRFTRFQELTRMMAESVNDVTTVQHNLLRNVDHASAALTAQSRLNRELSQSLMSVRMVPFNSVIDRLYRIVRQVAKELDKRVNLDVRGGQLELDRSVLEKMIGPIEHLLRNSIAHGVEAREIRRAAGKPEIGEIVMTLIQQGNEIIIELADDGAGLNYARIRAKAIEQGLLAADQEVDEKRLAQFIFMSGFSTASQVSEVAGRGVGMDVVKSEATSLGGRIEISSEAGKGTRFRIFLPLTLSVTQALLIRSGSRTYALPSAMVEQVMELKPEAAEKIRSAAGVDWMGARYPWHYLAVLLDEAIGLPAPARRHWILLLKGADQQIALEVDGLVGNQEIVVKNIGPQLARVPGVAGATVLNDGQIALILNPLVLASRELSRAGDVATALAAVVPTQAPAPVNEAATVMVVDDSMTVRKISSRMLAREGYQVVTAKDGVDALEQLLEFVPAAMLVDIEMPRMDGFELTRNVRADARLKDVPIIMITSRIADKHRNYAREIGVNEYLGKPYDEEQLLGLIRGFVEQRKAIPAEVI
jgi:chemosensory pili system protein ChpA (sensor histidine kinase/response regulator)